MQYMEEKTVARRQFDPYRNTLFKWAASKSGCVLSVSRGRSYDLTAACRVTFMETLTAAGTFLINYLSINISIHPSMEAICYLSKERITYCYWLSLL